MRKINSATDLSGEMFAALQRVLPQHALSRLLAKLADAQTPWLKNWLIRRFIASYKVDLSEALEEDTNNYNSFNAFFTRHLKPQCRPICEKAESFICPVDGTISQIGNLQNDQLIQAKGMQFSATSLLGSNDDADLFTDGYFTTIYLSPKDYHRVHMPIAGRLLKTRYIPGKLFSVNTTTTQHIPNLFANNERLVCFFETEIGKVAVILVGAMLVAGIGTTWRPQYQPAPGYMVDEEFGQGENLTFKKGEELGYFNFGSTVILLCEQNSIDWLEQFETGSVTRMGKQLAKLKN